MADPLEFDRYSRYNWPTVEEAGVSGPPGSPSDEAGGWLKKVMENPKFPIALGIVLLYIILFFAYMYVAMAHIMIVNIPPPQQPPQWVIDQSHQMGHDWPTPTPSPEYLMATDVFLSLKGIWIGFLIMGIWMLAEWPIIALVLHLFAKVFKGSGNYFPGFVSAIGYTYVPKVLAMMGVVLVVTLLPVYKVDFSNYQIDFMRFTNQSNFSVAQVLTFAGLLCSSLLGVAAVRYRSRISWAAATLVVGLPLAVYLIYYFL